MIERALDAELPIGWVTAHEAYGQVGRLRMWLEQRVRGSKTRAPTLNCDFACVAGWTVTRN
jgi:hypothetical protein